MQQSNAYIITFSIVLTIVFGGALSLTSVGLKPLQDKQVEIDTKKKILGAVMDISAITDPNELLALYDKKVESMVVDINGEVIEQNKEGLPLVAEKVNIQKMSKVSADEKYLPVFMFMSDDGSAVESYILPTFGSGLWDWISGYVALENDLNTVKGIAFDHKGETPGLGARITEASVQSRFVGKKIYDEDGGLVSIIMVKGEGNTGLDEHQVDGLSGATLTAKGVNAMLDKYLEYYSAFIEKTKTQKS